ncbi:MAG: MATE family efflux transporter [Halobacteriaceae archaeon]
MSVWRKSLHLGWPVSIQHILRTLMRTTDIIVTGLFSPAAIAALGLADLYARLPLRIGLGLGSGAISLSSQETGRDIKANRDQAITQALILGILLGLPFLIGGILFGQTAIKLLGAPHSVAVMGGTYLMIIFLSAPARHVALIAARSLQGIGQTKTPMYIHVVANSINISGTVILGLGIGFAPRLRIVGVALATAIANTTAAILFFGAFQLGDTVSLVKPSNHIITKQLIRVSGPKTLGGFARTAANFPFNAILLILGVEVNAAYQIGRRLYQQLTAPLARAYNVVASILVGQAIGEGDYGRAKFNGWAIGVLGLGTIGTLGMLIFIYPDPLVRIFTSDPSTAVFARGFAKAFGLAASFATLYRIFAGALQGAGDTKKIFVAQVVSIFLFLVGGSYVLALLLDFGALGVYIALVSYYIVQFLMVAYWFINETWLEFAQDMIDEREQHQQTS